VTSKKRAFRPRFSFWTQFHAVISAGQQAFTGSLIHPAIVLSTIAYLLGGNTYQIAGFSAIAAAAWALGRFVVQPLVFLIGSTRPIAIAGLILRTGAIVLIGIIGYRLDHIRPENIITALLICYAFYEVGSTTAVITTNGQIATTYTPSKREAFFRWRRVIAVAAAFLGAIVVEESFRRMSTDATPSIKNILMLAAVAAVASAWFMFQIPSGSRRDISAIPAPLAEGIGSVLASPPIRRFLAFRFILGLSTLADPFVIIYGMREIGFSLHFTGLALIFFVGLQLAGTVVWPRWLAAHSSLRTIQLAVFCRLIFLVLAISIPTIATSSYYTDHLSSNALAAWSFVATFGFLGFSTSIHNVANQRYLLDLTTRTSPQPAIALTNLLLGVVAFAPLGGGWIASRYSLEATVATAAAIAFVAFVASALLVESRVRVSSRLVVWGPTSNSNRNRRARTAN
jgi:hypothetical protein